MTEDDLKIFVSGTSRYFERVSKQSAQISTPFLKGPGDNVMYDFAAVIGVTGSQRGCVYYTAPRDMVCELVTNLGEEDDADDALLADYIGEIANTISGNAREGLGSGFMISVPVILAQFHDVSFPQETPAFVIPILWKKHRSALIICLKDGERIRVQ